MKKRLSAILVLALCVSLCGCGKSRQVQSVEEAISSLGKISLLSFEAIEEAEKMFTEECKSDIDMNNAREQLRKELEEQCNQRNQRNQRN